MNVCLFNADAKVAPFSPLPNFTQPFLQSIFDNCRNSLLSYTLHLKVFFAFLKEYDVVKVLCCFFAFLQRAFLRDASNKRRFSFEKSVSSIGKNGHLPVRGRIFFILILSLYTGKRFFAFSQGAFLRDASSKRRFSFEKTSRARGTWPCARTGGERYFLFLMPSLYIGKRFFAFLQGAFLGNQSDKRRISFKKTSRARGAWPCAPL
ncbi:Uncharacterised protein [Myroides odoratus]|uniref:Uncharacterized protein n=1 Tax=Myroides odoratus TaxID=256 RepID=A0A378RNK7_MYROD|nr:Uncharacterised protein [Myroides odoratus]